LALNAYLTNFKSNENQLFTELVLADAEEWKHKHEWMEKGRQLMLESGRKEQTWANMIGEGSFKGIDYGVVQQNSRNAIFFCPEGPTLSLNGPEHDKVKTTVFSNCQIDAR
jgi:hypothetical protein